MRLRLVGLYPTCNKSDKLIYARYSRKKVLRYPVTSVEILTTITGIALRKLIWSLRMLDRSRQEIGHWRLNAQIATYHIQGSSLLHGATNLGILLKIVWHILPIAV